MSKIREYIDPSDASVAAADILVRDEPDEDEDDNDNRKEDEDGNEDDDEGYSP